MVFKIVSSMCKFVVSMTHFHYKDVVKTEGCGLVVVKFCNLPFEKSAYAHVPIGYMHSLIKKPLCAKDTKYLMFKTAA